MPEALRKPPHEAVHVLPRFARTPPVTSEPFRLADDDGELTVLIEPLPPLARLSLRLRAEDAARIGAVAGLSLERPVNSFERTGGRSLLRLGPDEWLLRDEADRPLDLARDAVADLGASFHALVDVSHRNSGFAVEGEYAASLLNAGCPLDLSHQAFPPGTATRTLFGKAEVLLLRTGGTRFEIECWRSFAFYLFGFLREAARGL